MIYMEFSFMHALLAKNSETEMNFIQRVILRPLFRYATSYDCHSTVL